MIPPSLLYLLTSKPPTTSHRLPSASTSCDPVTHITNLALPLLATQRASWEQGAAAQAFYELYTSATVSLPIHLPTLYGLCHDAIVRQDPDDGRWCLALNKGDPGATDPACIGESMIYLTQNHLEAEEKERFLQSVEKMIDFLMNHAPRLDAPENVALPTQPISHRVDKRQLWSDTPYMMPPFLAAAGLVYDRPELITEGLHQILAYCLVLQDSTDGLWRHIYDGNAQKFERPAKWGVGNGWVCAGIIRCLRILLDPAMGEQPKGKDWAASHLTLVRRVRDVLESTLLGCLTHIRSDGLFHDIVDSPDSFVETNLAQMLVYTIYRYLSLLLIAGKELDRTEGGSQPLPHGWTKEWLIEMAERMYAAARQKVDQWGLVRDVCGSPRFNRPGTAAEGQVFALLMEVAREDYKEQQLARGLR